MYSSDFSLPGLPQVEIDAFTRFRWAQNLFDHGDYRDAARELERLMAQAESEELTTGLEDARLLLARAYYHSAQLGRAEEMARGVLATHPTEGYAALLLGRTMQRQGRREEAQWAMDLARALGAPGTGEV
ncbi:MAG: tetratricopeptide repeat protein [Micrococcales bacterium]|nr:tetratricopeptide repeat protein [Micrococcales bacterium]